MSTPSESYPNTLPSTELFHSDCLDGADRVHSTQANETDENDMENIRITEDFPQRVTKARTKLFPFLKKCHEKEQRAFLRLDTLVVDGQAYVYDETQGRPVPVK